VPSVRLPRKSAVPRVRLPRESVVPCVRPFCQPPLPLSRKARAIPLFRTLSLFVVLTVATAAGDPCYLENPSCLLSGSFESASCVMSGCTMTDEGPSTSTRKRQRRAGLPDDESFRTRMSKVAHLHPTPVKGNIIHCTTLTRSYNNVSHVLIADGNQLLQFSSEVLGSALLQLNLDAPNFHTASVFLHGCSLPSGVFRPQLDPHLPLRAQAIIEAAGRICALDPPVFKFATRPAQEDPGDSGDEGPMDKEVLSPFSEEETILIQAQLTQH
jgi:hypothetical protein